MKNLDFIPLSKRWLYRLGRFALSLYYQKVGWKIGGVDNIPREGAVIIASTLTTNFGIALLYASIPRDDVFVLMSRRKLKKAGRIFLPLTGSHPVTIHQGTRGKRTGYGPSKLLKLECAVVSFPEWDSPTAHKYSQKLSPLVPLMAEKSGAVVVPAVVWVRYDEKQRELVTVIFGDQIRIEDIQTEEMTYLEVVRKFENVLAEALEQLKKEARAS